MFDQMGGVNLLLVGSPKLAETERADGGVQGVAWGRGVAQEALSASQEMSEAPRMVTLSSFATRTGSR